MSERKVGRPCEKGGVCHWECVSIPKEKGIHMITWECKKCGVTQEVETTIE